MVGVREGMRVGVSRAARRPWVVAASLLALALIGWLVGRGPERDVLTGLWPVGLGAGAVLLAPARLRAVIAAAVGAIAGGVLHAKGFDGPLAAGVGLAVAVEVWVAARLLVRPDRARPELRSDDDLRRYFAACLGAGAVGAVLVGLTAVLGDVDRPARVAVAVGLAHAASFLSLVPFYLRLPTQAAIARGGERVAQWTTIVVAAPLLLAPEASPLLVFLVIPVLAWGALRITAVESLVQLLGVVACAVVLTSAGRGPFADLPMRYDLSVELRGVLLSAFCATCAVIVVPCALRVGEYLGAIRSAEAERDLVRGIVDGASGVAIIGTDPAGRITLFNPGAERLLGYAADEVMGRLSRTLHTDAAVTAKASELGVADDFVTVTQTMIDRHLVDTPIRFLRKDGVERVHAMTLRRVTVGDETLGFVATSEDITDQLDVEQTLRDALEVERRAVERLQQVDEVKDQFVSTVSHELRTPITSILGYLELLTDGALGDLSDRQRDGLLRVQSNSQRLLSLIDDLLTLSRVAEDGLRTREELDVRDAVRTAFAVVAPAWEPPRWLDVTLALPEDPVVVEGNAEMLERLVVNLLGNAVKFTDDGGSVTVSLCLDDGPERPVAVLRVADTGIGIPEAEQDQLFTRFFRSSLAEARAIQGSGLGLSITRAIAEHHGGTIEVRSRPGEGTVVDVRLPLAVPVAEDPPTS